MIPVGTTLQWRLTNKTSNGPNGVSQGTLLWQQKTWYGFRALSQTVQPPTLSSTSHCTQAIFEFTQVQVQGWHPELPAL